jgi:hypothetical protein
MSTCWQAYPTIERIPACGEVIETASAMLGRYLADFGLPYRPVLCVELLQGPDDIRSSFNANEPFSWSEGHYAWITVSAVPGGTDGYFVQIDDLDREYLADEMTIHERMSAAIQAAVGVGHYWSFRRSAGQPAIINIAYGFIAAAVAHLTRGFVDSIDCAWDHERLPATPEELCQFYMRSERALSGNNRDWAERCLAALPEELGGKAAFSP